MLNFWTFLDCWGKITSYCLVFSPLHLNFSLAQFRFHTFTSTTHLSSVPCRLISPDLRLWAPANQCRGGHRGWVWSHSCHRPKELSRWVFTSSTGKHRRVSQVGLRLNRTQRWSAVKWMKYSNLLTPQTSCIKMHSGDQIVFDHTKVQM